MIKLSVNETKWRSFLARTRAPILFISVWIFDFGPEKLPGLSRNGPLDLLLSVKNWRNSTWHLFVWFCGCLLLILCCQVCEEKKCYKFENASNQMLLLALVIWYLNITAITTNTHLWRVFSVCLNLSFRGRQSTVSMVFHALWQRRFLHRWMKGE